MLKLLHTADWHLGKELYGYDRKAEFDDFFSQLKLAIKENEINILIISGDIFDTANPGNATARTYYELINELHTQFPDLEVIVTGGNHDSPSYLNAPKDVLASFRTHVIGCAPRENGQIDFSQMVLELKKADETSAIICAVPFLRRGDMYCGENIMTVGDFYNEVISKALELRGEKNIPIIATGHLTTSNAKYSTTIGGEQVGGQDSIDANIFSDDISYLALGHIHRPQPIDGKRFIRYSGSPIAFSFAEKDYKHSLAIIEFDGKEIKEVRCQNLTQLIPLRTIPDEPQKFSEVKQILQALPDDEDMYLEVNMLQEEINPDTKAQLIEVLKDKKAKFCTFKKNIIKQNSESKTMQPLSAEEFKNTDPLKIIKEIYQNKQKTEMDEKYESMIKTLIDEL